MQLRIILISIALTIFFGQGNAQNNFVKFKEVYGLKIKVIKKHISKKIGCGSGLQEKKKNTLYEIQVLEIIYSKDTTVFMPDEILKIDYIIFPSSIQVTIGKEYDVTAGNTSVKAYIVGYRLFDINTIIHMDNLNGITIFYGLETCYKISLFSSLQQLFGLNKKNINWKKRDESLENAFYKYILKLGNRI